MSRTNLDVEGANCLPSVSLVVGFFFLFSFFFLDKSSNFSSDNLQSNETVEIIMTIVTIVCPLQGIRLACHEASEVQRTPTTVR